MSQGLQIKSLREWIATILAGFFSLLVVLAIVSGDIESVVINTLFTLLLAAYQRRFILDNDALLIRSQLKLFGIGMITFSVKRIALSSLNELVLTFGRAKNELMLTFSSEHSTQVERFDFRGQGELIKRLLSDSGIDYTLRSKETASKRGHKAAVASKDTVADVFYRHTSPGEILSSHSVSRFAMPLPNSQRKTVYIAVAFGLLITIGVVSSSQNWIAGCVLLVLTYLSYWLVRAHLCNQYYFIAQSPQSDIVVDEQYLQLPALLFTDKKARKVAKEQVRTIEARWNYYVVDSYSIGWSRRKIKRPHVVSLTFITDEGPTIAVSNMAINGQALLLALTHKNYPVSLERSTKQALPMLFHIRIAVLLGVVGIIISSMIRFL
ncbi:hypothetical protein FIU82_08220 [Pseudoalteromonas sp. THAF3]|uniref:hypothetical protein n=1 Tax=Pseudoalteromonas sp. THAF3 TaxID=2587843 RepID=UPI0012683CEF|nr:hypothetical protein [Pseudoalteromonas sp. THAF3]QFU05000.1 hypothetical protein FIU82_08220 [Pseudoalteromonas sp. THAF3]